jgi:hypothetical protein
MNMRNRTSDRHEDECLGFDISDEMLEHAAATDVVAIFTLNDCTTLSECPAS